MTSRFDDTRWATIQAPSAEHIGALADEAYRTLPQAFRDLAGDLVIRVEEFPDDDTLEEMGCETPFDLMGLFRGTGLAQGAAVPPTGTEPNMVFLYRRALLDYWCEYEEALGDIVAHVLIHEIGHHFGLSDEDMARIEAEADAGREGHATMQ